MNSMMSNVSSAVSSAASSKISRFPMRMLSGALLCMLTAMASSGATAHALLLSAQSQDRGIVGQVFYSDGTPAVDERVEFFNPVDAKAPGDIAQTGSDGRFRLATAREGIYNVVAYGMEGHRAEAAVVVGAPAGVGGGGGDKPGVNINNGAGDIALLRQDIARMEARIRLADIVGGIGYIVGIAGAAMFWLSRRKKVSASSSPLSSSSPSQES